MRVSSEEILESVGEAIFTVDREFRINFFNKAAEVIVGLKRSEVIGKFCKDILQTDYCQAECPIAAILASGESIYNFDSSIRSFNNQPKHITLNATLVHNGDHEPAGGIISFRVRENHDIIRKSANTAVPHFQGIIGKSPAMRGIFQLIREISASDAPVFIQGETGTGKEMIADAIQATSKRKDRPFVKVNCAVLPPELLASELFGHIRGAFTGAIKDRIGRFELANHGTIFLDEIAEMSPRMQLNLLRILQDGTFEKLGDSMTQRVNVRIIAATNVNIQQAISEGKFRADLYYRLNVVPIVVPPLQERLSDIQCLTEFFIKKAARKYQKPLSGLDDDVIEFLRQYHFPGNVRELENIIEFAVVRAKLNTSICLCNLPPYVRKEIPCSSEQPPSGNLDHTHSANLIELLTRYNWNRSKVARILGVDRTTIWRRLKKSGFER